MQKPPIEQRLPAKLSPLTLTTLSGLVITVAIPFALVASVATDQPRGRANIACPRFLPNNKERRNIMDGRLQLSRWCHLFNRHGVAAFFNTISMGLIFIPEGVAQLIVQLINERHTIIEIENLIGADVLNALKEEGILVSDDLADIDVFEEAKQKLSRDITLQIMYLVLTDHCNLACRYCFEEAPAQSTAFRPTHMTIEVAKASIDLFAKMISRYGNPKKETVIHLYGGEPLMNQRVVRFSIDYVQTLKKEGVLPAELKTAMVTNGTLVTDELAEFFAENGTTIGISIDGPQKITNQYRYAKNGGLNVFSGVMNALSLLEKHGVKVGLSVTLTPEAVQEPEQLISFLVEQASRINGVSLTPMYFNPHVPLPADYYAKATACQIAAFETFREVGIYEDRVMRKVKAFINRELMYADCGVVGNQLVVAPDGQIGVCQEFVKPRTYFQGSVLNPESDPIADGLFVNWKKRSPFFMDRCIVCPALGICGGGCPANTEITTGSRWNSDELACTHSKAILEWMIWDTYAQAS